MLICVLACRAGWGRPGARQADAAGRLSAVFVPGPTRLTLGHRESNPVASCRNQASADSILSRSKIGFGW